MNEIKEFFDGLADGWNAAEKRSKKEISDFVETYAGLGKGMKTLDVGCGTGIISDVLFDITNVLVTAIDLSPNMIRIAKVTHDGENIKFSAEDFYSFGGETFDAIVCFNAYPHFLDVEKFAEKAAELLNSGGLLVVLHNMSRTKLSKHHDSVAKNVSRNLLPVEKEADNMKKYFAADRLMDDDDIYLMRLRKI